MKTKSLAKNAVLNTIKQTSQILFSIITIPYITRTLGADSYGMVNYGNSIVSYFSLFAGLGISTYAIRECSIVRNDDLKINSLASQLFSFNIITTIISYCCLCLVLCNSRFTEYRTLISIQSIVIFFTTLGMDWLNTVFEDYLYITLRYVICHVISLLLMVILVKSNEDYLIYASILVFASAGANIANSLYLRKKVHIRFTFHQNLSKHFVPILLLFGNTVAITIYVNSDITMLGLMMGNNAVGIYSLSAKIYSVLKLIINGIVVVTIPRITRAFNKVTYDDPLKLTSKMMQVIFAILLPIVISLFFLSEYVLFIFGGVEFLTGTTTLRVLSVAVMPAIMAFFVTNCVLIPCKKEGIVLVITAISAVINVVLNLFMIPTLSYLGAGVTTLISEIIVSCIASIYAYSNGLCSFYIEKSNFYSLMASCIFLIFFYITILSFTSSFFCICVLSLVGIICYCICLILCKNSIAISLMRKYITRGS